VFTTTARPSPSSNQYGPVWQAAATCGANNIPGGTKAIERFQWQSNLACRSSEGNARQEIVVRIRNRGGFLWSSALACRRSLYSPIMALRPNPHQTDTFFTLSGRYWCSWTWGWAQKSILRLFDN